MRRIAVHTKRVSQGQRSTFVNDVTHNRVHWTTDHVKQTAQNGRDTGLVEVFLQRSNSDIASVDWIRSRMIPQFG
jgi:hypothetical protein